MLENTKTLLLSGGEGVHLLAYWDQQPKQSAPLAILIHGWEGTAESGYLLSATQHLYKQGFQVARLIMRDHDQSHHLNQELFHSCRLTEVVNATQDIIGKIQAPESFLGGFSLGGNFAIRIADALSQRDLLLNGTAAVCPVIIPANTMMRLELGPKIYHNYFLKKWRKSLQRKAQLFPRYLSLDSFKHHSSLRKLTDYFVERHTEYTSADEYFEGYSLRVNKLSNLKSPVDILMSDDDPIIDAKDTKQLEAHPQIKVSATRFGGHCGFIKNASFDCWSDQFIFEAFREKSKIL